MDAAGAVRCPFDHDNHVHGCRQLGVQAGSVQPAKRRQCLKPRWYFRDRVRMQGAGPTFVSGVERGEQVNDFRAANLTDHDSVWAHTQGLAHEIRNGDRSRSFSVFPAGREIEYVRVVGSELERVFNRDDALADVCLCKQC